MRTVLTASLVNMLVLILISPASGAAATDPNSPQVATLSPVPAPKPQKNERVTFHSAPKPLPKGAITHDWTSFLGD